MDEKDNQKDFQKQQSFGYKRYSNRRKRYHRITGKTVQTERSKSTFKKISLVIPLYNEEESVIPLSHEIRKALSRVNIDYEVILVDDGSTDASLKT